MIGWLNGYKPQGMTSQAYINKVRRILGIRKIGHAGTLDPFAEGVLPLAIGEATKTIAYVMMAQKSYKATMRWGIRTNTADYTGQIIQSCQDPVPSLQTVQRACEHFLGGYNQMPPRYSALKIQGKRACDRARLGEDFELRPRVVEIFSLSIDNHDEERAETSFTVFCGPGTYIRSLAEDMAIFCGHLGTLISLQRVQVGKFLSSDAISLENLYEIGHKVLATQSWAPVLSALDDILAICLSPLDVQEIRFGRCVHVMNHGDQTPLKGDVLCVDKDRQPIAIGILKDGAVYPKRVFNS